ncbi:MAG TPA: RagB/SusD family nutrient uptake outer membrane protein, partial [Spirochaetota bacterium]|nr:RagB/SusD family nutrient uptake outer membrane protein [Spirochaetota bacterium]
YYNAEGAKDRIAAQERGFWNNIDGYFKGEAQASDVTLGSWKVVRSNIQFTIPFPDTDLAANPRLSEEPVSFDFSSIGY